MTDAAVEGVTRHFVTVGQRQIHYRRAGNGPPLVALHRLPRSGRDLLPLIQRAMSNFTVFAPDLAGYGNSWPLPIVTPTIADYALDICAFLDAIGLTRTLFYGEREGAAVALEIARRAPLRGAALAASELEIWTPQDGDEGTQSFKPFIPAWDGSHLTWLWAYLREENVFQPWWRKRLSARVANDMPTPYELHTRAVQFLSGGSQGRGYELGINASLLFDPRLAVSALLMSIRFPPFTRNGLGTEPWRKERSARRSRLLGAQ